MCVRKGEVARPIVQPDLHIIAKQLQIFCILRRGEHPGSKGGSSNGIGLVQQRVASRVETR
jgi:hypothetical protein